MWQIILPPINLHSIGQRKHMISEVDLADWHKVDWNIGRIDPDGRHRMSTPQEWLDFYEQVREVYMKQMKIIPALLRKDFNG